MGKGPGLLQEIHDRNGVVFWTSEEACRRCMQITTHIGGERELRRAEALFPHSVILTAAAEAQFWRDSRYPPKFIPLFPARLYLMPPHPRFLRALTKVCRDVLQSAPAANGHVGDKDGGPVKIAVVAAHGEERDGAGWTVLTTTKSSVKCCGRCGRCGWPAVGWRGPIDSDAASYAVAGRSENLLNDAECMRGLPIPVMTYTLTPARAEIIWDQQVNDSNAPPLYAVTCLKG
ncbi:hypothetical protein GGX14DRAFT_624653 [Mycena pura]|uniref:Uncharacterized protein n=1 Tax=Mycena pura TaxID=153505 RepID=A0AAD6YB93_9AGAR|nr:hypothetical protein GGX14DRAFT_624653 [Mycena pura]